MSVDKVRQSVLKLVSESPEQYEERDLDTLRRDDVFVQKFFELVDGTETQEETINEVIMLTDDCLRRRKSSDLLHFVQNDFPIEFYQHNGVALSRDARGDRIIYFLGHLNRPSDDFRAATRDWIFFEIKKFEDTNRGSIIFDVKRMGLSNCDLRLTSDVFTALELFPTMDLTFYFVDVHFVLNPVLKLVMKFVPNRFRDRLKVLARSELHELFGKEFLWTELGGDLDIVKNIPEKCCTLEEFAEKRNLSIENVNKTIAKWKNLGIL